MLKRIVFAQRESLEGSSAVAQLSCGHRMIISLRHLKASSSLTHIECPVCIEAEKFHLDETMEAFHTACFGK